jgi:hypothetical protein
MFSERSSSSSVTSPGEHQRMVEIGGEPLGGGLVVPMILTL